MMHFPIWEVHFFVPVSQQCKHKKIPLPSGKAEFFSLRIAVLSNPKLAAYKTEDLLNVMSVYAVKLCVSIFSNKQNCVMGGKGDLAGHFSVVKQIDT